MIVFIILIYCMQLLQMYTVPEYPSVTRMYSVHSSASWYSGLVHVVAVYLAVPGLYTVVVYLAVPGLYTVAVYLALLGLYTVALFLAVPDLYNVALYLAVPGLCSNKYIGGSCTGPVQCTVYLTVPGPNT